jgi:hypothetical protein
MQDERKRAPGGYRLPDGDLMVPARAESDDGVIGDGMVRVSPGDPLYEAWLPHVDDDPEEQR